MHQGGDTAFSEKQKRLVIAAIRDARVSSKELTLSPVGAEWTQKKLQGLFTQVIGVPSPVEFIAVANNEASIVFRATKDARAVYDHPTMRQLFRHIDYARRKNISPAEQFFNSLTAEQRNGFLDICTAPTQIDVGPIPGAPRSTSDARDAVIDAIAFLEDRWHHRPTKSVYVSPRKPDSARLTFYSSEECAEAAVLFLENNTFGYAALVRE